MLTQVVTQVDGLRLDRADADTKGDLFEHVLKQIKQAGELGQQIAAMAVIVDAEDERAESFYRHFDFQPLQQAPLRLFLPMAQIAELFA